MMREVWLHGRLRKKYGSPFRLEVGDAAEAIRALTMQIKGLRADIEAGAYTLVYGDLRRGVRLSLDALGLHLGDAQPLHIMPCVTGHAGSGKAILGGLLIVAAIALAFTPAGAALGVGALSAGGASTGLGAGFVLGGGVSISLGQVALMGGALLLAGISQMLSPQPQAQSNVNNYIFQGPANVARQGVARPVVYGRCIVGSVLVGSALRVGDMLTSLAAVQAAGGPTKTGMQSYGIWPVQNPAYTSTPGSSLGLGGGKK